MSRHNNLQNSVSIKYVVLKIHKESGFIVMFDIRVISQAKVMNYVRAYIRKERNNLDIQSSVYN